MKEKETKGERERESFSGNRIVLCDYVKNKIFTVLYVVFECCSVVIYIFICVGNSNVREFSMK